MLKILVVENGLDDYASWSKDLSGKVEILKAFSLKEAEDKFLSHNQELVAIIVNVYALGDKQNLLPSVCKFRKVFKGPLIAISREKEDCPIPIEPGCNIASGHKFRDTFGISLDELIACFPE